MTSDPNYFPKSNDADLSPQDEEEASNPSGMISSAEAAFDGPVAPDRESAWNTLRDGVTEHERGTFKAFEAQRETRDITPEMRAADPSGGEFLWLTAIEGSTIPQMNVDQMDWTQHYNFWRQDLQRVRADLGIKHLRVSPPWYKINPGPGIYDWSWWDEYVEYAVGVLGFELIVDLAHFGTPLWMLQQFGDGDFAPRLAEYAGEFARRYKGTIRAYCPVNEPYITALFCGDLGCWPPFRTGQENFPPMMANITRGIIDASYAIRAEQPDATLFYVDTTENAWSPDAALAETVEQRNLRRFISFDMALGMVDNNHALLPWLLENNFAEADLRYFLDHPAPVDIIGLDYYPQSEAILTVKPDGGYRQRDMMGVKRVDKLFDPAHLNHTDREWPIGFYGVAKAYQARYNKPIMLAETNWCGGPIEHRLRWMDYTLDDCKRLRAEGIPLIGYCWWGAYDHMDWGLALRLHSGKVHHVGLWELHRREWILQRVPCGLLDRYRHAIHHTHEVVGSHPLRSDSILRL